jgi:ABC-type polysaccharide/polyol phosphate export permease
MELNPFYYIINGYRDAFINHVWFWERISTIYFIIFSLILFVLGARLFQKLRPHFMDVL